MNAALFRRFAGGSPALLAVWGGQTERETPLCNIKLHAARVRVCVGLAALVGVLSGIGGKPFLQVGVVGADMDKGVFLAKPYIGGLFLLRKPCSHKLSFLRPCYAIGAFRVFFLALDKAKQIALRGAGLDEATQKIVFTREELSRNQGKPCYILEFYTDKCAYSYKVDAVSGDILEKNIEWRSLQESEPVSETVQSSDSNQRRLG